MIGTYRRVGGITGLILVASALAVNLAPSMIAGESISGTVDVNAILRYYNHPAFVGIFWYGALTGLFLVIFALALRYALKDAASSSGTELWLLAAVGAAFVEAPLVITQFALQSTLITIAGSHATTGSAIAQGGLEASALSLFRLWDILYNSLMYWTEAAWLLFFSIVLLKTRVFAHWIGWVGVTAGSLHVFNTLAVPLSLPNGLTFPGNLVLSAWFVAISISLLRLKVGQH